MRIRLEWTVIIMTLCAVVALPGAKAFADEREERSGDFFEDFEGEHEEEFEDDMEDFEEILEELAEEAEEAMTAEARKFIQENLGEAEALLEHLRRFATLDPDPEAEFHLLERIIDLGYTAQHLMELKKIEEAEFATALEGERLSLKTELLGIEYHDAEDGKKAEIEKELRTALEESFLIQQEFREEEAEMLKEELERLRELLEKRRENKAIIIERRLQELIHGEDPFAW
jgi:hypothetical protein